MTRTNTAKKSLLDFFKTSNTIRSQLTRGNLAIMFLLVVAGAMLFWQINLLINAVNTLQISQSRALSALEVQQASTQVMASINRLLPLEDSSLFRKNVSADLQNLRDVYGSWKLLIDDLSEDSSIYPYAVQVNTRLDSLIGIVDTMVRQAGNEQWSSVKIRVGILSQNQQQLSNDTKKLVNVARIAQSSAIQEVHRVRGRVVDYIIAILLIGGGFATMLTRHLIKNVAQPIAKLTLLTTEIAEGNLEQFVNISSQNEIGRLAASFNVMTERIQDLFKTLESRIQERTRALEVSMEISSQMTSIQSRERLLEYVVNRIHLGYDLYATAIFSVEANSDDLVLTMGYGDIGRQMMEQDYRQKIGVGIVGTVASTNKSFMSNNVTDVLNFDANPLLPNTQSELAVPLRVGRDVVGVLDVQSTKKNRFKPEDVTLIQSLADQTATALQNIKLVEEAREVARRLERMNSQLTQTAWTKFGEEVTTSGFRYQGGQYKRVVADSEAWLPLIEIAASRHSLVTHKTKMENGTTRDEIAVPLQIRGETIGYLGVARNKTKNWGEEEVEVVKAVAGQVAMALENARLSKSQEETIVRLREVDSLKSKFLTSMSHELRTPLNSIIGFADLLLQGIDGELSENAMTDVTAIYNSGKHLLALINDILDLSKIEANRMELVRSPIDVPTMFDEVLASVSSLVANRPIKLVQEVSQDLPKIWADPLRINQIMINLVSNAIKFTEEGQVTLGATLFNERQAHIFVEDTGIGIPEDKFDLVFEQFRQVDSRDNRKFQGTGMGLAISKQLVELHGGEMWIESTVGKGSVFNFTIPFAEVETSKTSLKKEKTSIDN